jgi:hypothetical protein
MPTLAPQKTAPYVRPNGVLSLIERQRRGKLPQPITTHTLRTIGVPASIAHQPILALKFLGLIDEDGYPTEAFIRLRDAGSADYPGVLADIVRAAYAPIFQIIDPTEDDHQRILDAFQPYQPGGQRERMVQLFLALCAEAGIVPKPEGPARIRTPRPPSANPRRQRDQGKPPPDPPPDTRTNGRDHVDPPPLDPPRSDYHRLLATLIDGLPSNRQWGSKTDRDNWLTAMTSMIDWLIKSPVEPDSP